MNTARARLIAGAILAAILIAAGWAIVHREGTAPVAVAPPQVDLATARFGSIDVAVDAVGRIGPSAGSQSKLAFAVAGRIASVTVHVGERVAAGDTLATLDAAGFSLARRQAMADADAAQAQLRAASVDRIGVRLRVDRAALTRTERLYAVGVSARKDVDAARAQVAADIADARTASADRAAAAAQAQSAQARAAISALDASNTALRAPANGIVTAIYRSAGESVDAAVPVIGLAPAQTAAVTLLVAGRDAARVAPGQPVTLRVDQIAHSIPGTVVGVASAVDPVTQSAEVSVRMHATISLAGSAVTARIVVGRNRGILIPHDAIVVDPQSGATLVFVRSAARQGSPAFTQRRIDIAYDNGTLAEVTGLRAGERVAAHGAFELLAPADS